MLRSHDGRTIAVESVSPTDEVTEVYNLRIASTIHTSLVRKTGVSQSGLTMLMRPQTPPLNGVWKMQQVECFAWEMGNVPPKPR